MLELYNEPSTDSFGPGVVLKTGPSAGMVRGARVAV